MRARRRPCSAPLRQAGGIPAAGRAGHPRRGNTPRFHACPSLGGPGAGGYPSPSPSAAPTPPPPQFVRRSGASRGSPWDGMEMGRESSARCSEGIAPSQRPAHAGHADGVTGHGAWPGAAFFAGGVEESRER